MIVWYNDSKPESSIRDRNSEFAKHMTIKWSLRLVCIYIFYLKTYKVTAMIVVLSRYFVVTSLKIIHKYGSKFLFIYIVIH